MTIDTGHRLEDLIANATQRISAAPYPDKFADVPPTSWIIPTLH